MYSQQSATNNNNNKSNKKKRHSAGGSGGGGAGAAGGEGCSEAGGAGDGQNSEALKEKKPLHTSMEQLQMQQGNNSNPSVSRRNAGSNWNAARGIAPEVNPAENAPEASSNNGENAAPTMSKSARMRQKRKAAQQRNKYVAMDCEMVGVGLNGQDDMLARVSIVNRNGDVLLDKFVKPQEKVVDYRTPVSGIRQTDIEHAEEFLKVQDEVVEMLQDKILVGHAIRNDLAVLHIKHPYSNIRDTSRYKPLCRLVSNGRTPSLKRLSQAILGMEIQTGEHNSVEDARATMKIYNYLSSDWEKHIQRHKHGK